MSWPLSNCRRSSETSDTDSQADNEGRSRHCMLHAHEVIHGWELDDESCDVHRDSKNCAIYTVL